MDNLIDAMITDCNTAIQKITSGNYVAWCGYMYMLVQKLVSLKDEIRKKDDEIKTLKKFIDDLNGGADDGTK